MQQRILILLTLFTLLVGTQQVMAADVKIAFVNTPKLMELAPQAIEARKVMDQEFKPREAELVAMRDSIEAKAKGLEANSLTMTPDDARMKEREINALKLKFQNASEDFAADLEARRTELLQKLQQEISAVIIKIAKDGEYDVILENGVVYVSERIDITDQVITALKKK